MVTPYRTVHVPGHIGWCLGTFVGKINSPLRWRIISSLTPSYPIHCYGNPGKTDNNNTSIMIRGGSRICGKGGAVATASAAGAKVFGGSRLKTLFGISKGGGARAPCAPPPPLNPLVMIRMEIIIFRAMLVLHAGSTKIKVIQNCLKLG